MADKFIQEFLISTIGDPRGRRLWLERKVKVSLVDLAGGDFTERDFRDYDLSDANLSTAIFLAADLSGADFSDADLSFADLRRAKLRNCCMDRSNLASANLQGACLTDAQMEEAKLGGARLSQADLVGADLSLADLRGADLRGACLKYVRLTGAKLDEADVEGADLTGSVFDDDAPLKLRNFDLAIIDDRKYRVLKSHLSISQTTEVVPAPRKEAKPEKEKEKSSSWRVRPRRREKDPTHADEGANVVASYVATADDLLTEEGWHRILGIEFGTPLAGVTKAFRQKAKLYHPDRTRHLSGIEQASASVQFRLAREAYEHLTRKMAKPLVHLVWVPSVPKRRTAYDYSIDEYVLLARANPRSTDVLYNLAWKYFDQGLLDDAIEAYEKVLDINPKDDDARYNLRVVKLCKTFDVVPESALDAPSA